MIMGIVAGCKETQKRNNNGSELEPEMVYIDGGTFNMGSNKGSDEEKPVHSVTVSSFYIGKYEVTNCEYSIYDPKHKGRWSEEDYPVDSVNWADVTGYCEWLSKKTGKNYRLPTEAEWEYACRGGTTTEYYWGDEMNNDYSWYKDNSEGTIHPVGNKEPNKFGLYDMSGNVWEWCFDWHGEDYYSSSPSSNPRGPSSGTRHIARGGSWGSFYGSCSSGARGNYDPGTRRYYMGFRLVRTP